jgi:hypothetical protein
MISISVINTWRKQVGGLVQNDLKRIIAFSTIHVRLLLTSRNQDERSSVRFASPRLVRQDLHSLPMLRFFLHRRVMATGQEWSAGVCPPSLLSCVDGS